MKKSATEVMQEIVTAAVIDGIGALKAASQGLPNNLLRDLNAIHANTAVADLPPQLQSAIQASVREALSRLLREGYVVAPKGDVQPPRPPRPQGPPGDRPRRGPPPRHGGRDERGPRPDRPRGPRRPPGGGKPSR